MQPGALVAEKYRVERVIGRGGMGLVVEATHVMLGTRVALKFLAEAMVAEPTALARFNREARASAQLVSEHVCRVSDFGIEGTQPYIVMELLVGTDLSRLAKVRMLDMATAALYIRQACLGVADAHAAGIVHRDLKPGNLFLTRRPDGRPLIKVLDFGVATAPASDGDARLTATAHVVGSPGYMAPEQIRASKKIDGRADIWALGVNIYKLVSGRLPFAADGFAEFALAVTRTAPAPLPEVPAAFAAIVMRCLEKEPANRYVDAIALADALAPYADRAQPSQPGLTSMRAVPVPERPTPVPPLAVAPAAAPPVSPARSPAKAVARTILGVATAVDKLTAIAEVPAPPAPPAPPATTVADGGAAGAPVAPRAGALGELPGGTMVGEYRVDRVIGQGGMGVVYAATHPLIGKKVAIKVIGAELGTNAIVVERFMQEARSVNQIGHPNLVDVFAFGELPDGRNYFVMELLEGESLRAKLTRMLVSLAETVQILDEVAAALEAAHEMQIVHRDLKPDNVFLAAIRGGLIIVKLLDFGIAKLAAGEGIPKTHTGELIGTPAYLSPEQARGKDVDHRTDIYALGCLLFEMTTGRLPFIAQSPMDTVMMHLTTQVQRPRELKPEIPLLLEQLTLQMLDKNPAQRPTLAQVRDVFAELVATGVVQIEPGTGATFRSDLARGASGMYRGGPRTPRGPDAATRREGGRPAGLTPSPPILGPAAPTAMPTGGRRRNAAPSDAPTSIEFTPGAATITPSEHAATRAHAVPSPRPRWPLVVAIGSVLAMGAVVAYVVLASDPGAAAGAAGSAAAVVPADAGAADAAVVGGDAAVAAVRTVEIRITPPTARLEIDGQVVPSPGGVARAALPDGPHAIVGSAPGRTPYAGALAVTAATAPIEIKLERAKAGGEPRSGPVGKPVAAPTHTPTVAKPVPGSDETIDPFQ